MFDANHNPGWQIEAHEAFAEALRIAGGQGPLAKICPCTQGNISQLVRRGSLLPSRFVLNVEAGTGVSRHRLRPDIYPDPSPISFGGSCNAPATPFLDPSSLPVRFNPQASLNRKDHA
ncbi:DNA-binding transcriptional regulator YdaS (Cro superfamily) [Sphingobium wenxiniae]|uniref:YdaS antitoxin of YdaST toxin-antitoxin system n=1 Tax=Sphingobium wenxiniae (strain DSM 21828 / CGMCC 1.7748 / JZ-1) TaxID=595605 RepID=A0A562KCT1_SPHWJ|nr:YdaS family helix-turn-helix protein [Sphingobium wenxiniae]MBB6191493.1 DNA-binding transcriptional regulator YdaS (Cro superfamily) [Sphingobium wenxiniae]TWH93216.1 YdaS antitoxin of YdaST toxin-antitoxin system [Sphingobium wenxiniae]